MHTIHMEQLQCEMFTRAAPSNLLLFMDTYTVTHHHHYVPHLLLLQ